MVEQEEEGCGERRRKQEVDKAKRVCSEASYILHDRKTKGRQEKEEEEERGQGKTRAEEHFCFLFLFIKHHKHQHSCPYRHASMYWRAQTVTSACASVIGGHVCVYATVCDNKISPKSDLSVFSIVIVAALCDLAMHSVRLDCISWHYR